MTAQEYLSLCREHRESPTPYALAEYRLKDHLESIGLEMSYFPTDQWDDEAHRLLCELEIEEERGMEALGALGVIVSLVPIDNHLD